MSLLNEQAEIGGGGRVMAGTKTKQERVTELLEKKATDTLKKRYPKYFEDGKYKEPELYYIGYIQPHEVMRFDIAPLPNEDDDKDDDDKNDDNEEYIYIVWDGKEMSCYDDPDEAFGDVLVGQRERRISERWLFIASPLIISGVLAVAMLIIIGVEIFRGNTVPQPLWTIFTAVIAFYFGKEGWSILRQADRRDD